MIDYYKYLKCPACVDAGLYCKPHRKEVETILNKNTETETPLNVA